MMKKIIGGLLTTCLLVGCLTGCGGSEQMPGTEGNSGSTSDGNKTELVVATYDGGLGTTWLQDAATRFEEKYADVSFEEGKKGVQISIVKNASYEGAVVLSSMKHETADVWFTENVDYYAHINAGNFADITDIVTKDLTEYGEDRAIEDKIDSDYRTFLNAGTAEEPTYYAIPFYDSIYGLSYDKDMFEEYNLYFKSSGTEAGDAADSIDFVSSKQDKKSAGVDGKYDTYDDGLPATYAQLLKLVKKMTENEIVPFIYAGSNAIRYPMRTMSSFWAQAEEAEGYRLNVSFDGTAENLVKLDSNGKVVMGADGNPQVESLTITSENGYELQRQESKYQVLKLFHDILSDTSNYSESNFLQTAAQTNFIKGAVGDYTRYGMLFDGVWWVNEAKESFDSLAGRFGDEYSMKKRNIALMPLPVATAEDVGRGNVLLNGNATLAFIRSNTELLDCAKAFLEFTSTDAELSAFTASTSMTRALNYEIGEEYLEELTPFAKSFYALKQASTVVYPYTNEGIFPNNQALFSIENWGFGTVINNTEYNNPWELWVASIGSCTSEEYFEGMYQNQKIRWSAVNK